MMCLVYQDGAQNLKIDKCNPIQGNILYYQVDLRYKMVPLVH